MSSITVADSKRPASAKEDDDDEHQQRQDKQSQQQQQQQQQQQAAGNSTTPEDKSTAPPQPKRRRVADSARVRAVRACQRCRRLKEKCDGRQPCQRCYRSGRDCEFAPVGMSVATAAAISNNKLGGPAAAAAAKTPQHRTTKSEINPRETSLAVAENARTEERTKCLERLVQHLLGDVPLDLTNLRRMADKAGRRTESDNGSTLAGNDELDDLTLEDENFTVKTLSQSTARESTLPRAGALPVYV